MSVNSIQHIDNHCPVRLGLVAVSIFGTALWSQIRLTRGIHILGIADANPQRVATILRCAGWPDEQFGALSFESAFKHGNTCITNDTHSLIANPLIDVIISSTGNDALSVDIASVCRRHDKKLVMFDNDDPSVLVAMLKIK